MAPDKRKCFGCGLEGHNIADCPEEKKQKQQSKGHQNKVHLIGPDGDDVVHAMVMTDSEGFQRVGRQPVGIGSFRFTRAGLFQQERQKEFRTQGAMVHNAFDILSPLSAWTEGQEIEETPPPEPNIVAVPLPTSNLTPQRGQQVSTP